MSNIDFDLLADIDTSPTQPDNQSPEQNQTNDSNQNNLNSSVPTNLLNVINQAESQIATEPESKHSEEIVANVAESRLDSEPPEDPENDNGSNVYSSTRSNTATPDVQVLLNKQSEKLELKGKLDELIKQRLNVKSSINEVAGKLKTLKDSQHKSDVNNRLNEYLENSNQNYIESQSRKQIEPSREATPGLNLENGSTVNIINELNVLPSNNWDDRIDNIRKFYPYVDLEKIKPFTTYNQDGIFLRGISFTVVCPLFFKLNVEVRINSLKDSIESISVNQTQLVTLRLISPSVSQAIGQFVQQGEIDLFMYALNSLSIVAHERTSLLFKIIKKYRSYIEDEKFKNLIEDESLSNNRIFAIMKSVNQINLVIDKNNELYHIKLYWDIKLNDLVTGNCKSSLKLLMIRQSDNTKLKNVNNLFQNLIKEYGIFSGLDTLLKSIFGINAEI